MNAIKYFILLHVFIGSTQFTSAQSHLNNILKTYEKPYAINWKTDVPIASIGLGLTLSQLFTADHALLNYDYVLSLQNKEVNEFDESAINNYSYKAQKASDILLYTSMSAPMLLLADPSIRADWKNTLLITSETFLVGMGLTLLAKNLSNRPRPFLYNDNIAVEDKLGADGTNSFFSGHTSMTALSTFMMAKIITDHHPHTKLKPFIWATATAIPVTTGILRYQAGKHFFTDIIAGFTVGALTGYFVPFIHQSIKQRRDIKQHYSYDYFGDKIYY
ncbi:MAG: phosphatase PAP2 family protein [Chitinophagales bacterium]